ncbi:alkaline phosphatase [Sphingomonas spermidinifaciens]|uniref:Alkaline phosphatase n=1 Tax=Sphingomonas spermidinifaciens TaxID=1141889 RepID=A0A2A4B4Z0_9SPHN|nr:DedA family protein [Sphingomonas spermidinifaciens]PCD03127.1 alkaline phosphatase [Sphingomonas spermidinifaciens]
MTDRLIELVGAWGYLGIAIAMFLENVFPPIPSEVIMGLTGMAVADGKLGFVEAVTAGTIGAVLGNWVWYWIGRVVGYARFKPLIDRFGRWLTLDWAEVEKIVGIFTRYDRAIVFWARFLPTVRTMISLPAGMLRMSQVKFLFWTTLGTAIWNAVLIGAGYILKNEFGQFERYYGPVAIVLMVAVVILYLYRVFTWKPQA